MSTDVSEELALRVERLNRKLTIVTASVAVLAVLTGLFVGFLYLTQGFQDSADTVLRERVNRIEKHLSISSVEGVPRQD